MRSKADETFVIVETTYIVPPNYAFVRFGHNKKTVVRRIFFCEVVQKLVSLLEIKTAIAC